MIPLSQIRKKREAVAEACDAALSAKALAAHDKKCHGGHYEGGKCKFRESNGEAEEKPTAAEEYIEAVRKDAKGKPVQQPKLSARAQFAAVVKKYKGTKQWLKAPNGKKSKLTERQWVQVRTQSFKDWFGPWEESSELDFFLSNANRNSFDKEMFVGMGGSFFDTKIFDSIISLIPVDMMDNFGGKKSASYMLFHNPSMFVDILFSFSRNSNISSFLSTFIRSSEIEVALARTKLATTKATTTNREFLSAIDTFQNNLIYVNRKMSQLLPTFGKMAFNKSLLNRLPLAPIGTEARGSTSRGKGLSTNSANKIHETNYSILAEECQTKSMCSQMLDANGEPAVFWHGSYKNNEFTVFDIKKCAVIRGVKGFYFSPDERRDEVAGQHGEGDERPFFLNLRKPLKCDPDRELTKKDKEKYDGVVRINPDDNWEHHFYDYRKGKMRHTVSNKGDIIEAVAFWANQIKSADKNCGDFSAASKDILE